MITIDEIYNIKNKYFSTYNISNIQQFTKFIRSKFKNVYEFDGMTYSIIQLLYVEYLTYVNSLYSTVDTKFNINLFLPENMVMFQRGNIEQNFRQLHALVLDIITTSKIINTFSCNIVSKDILQTKFDPMFMTGLACIINFDKCNSQDLYFELVLNKRKLNLGLVTALKSGLYLSIPHFVGNHYIEGLFIDNPSFDINSIQLKNNIN